MAEQPRSDEQLREIFKNLPKEDLEELRKPLVFPNSQRRFKAFNGLVAAGILIYCVFWADFGEKEHVFSGIRRYAKSFKDSLYEIKSEDEEYVQKRLKELQEKVSSDDLINAAGTVK